jgi:large subunit ribosomal protein L10
MSRQLKNLVVEELRKRYDGADSALVVRIIGLDAVSNNVLRRRLRDKRIEMHVVKNSLAKVALKGTPLETLANSLDGPAAVVTGGDSIIDAARELVSLAKDKQFGKLELEFGVIEGDGQIMRVERIASMRSRRQLHADIAACAAGVGRRLAGCIAGPAGRIAGCLKAVVEKGEKAEQVAPAA